MQAYNSNKVLEYTVVNQIKDAIHISSIYIIVSTNELHDYSYLLVSPFQDANQSKIYYSHF